MLRSSGGPWEPWFCTEGNVCHLVVLACRCSNGGHFQSNCRSNSYFNSSFEARKGNKYLKGVSAWGFSFYRRVRISPLEILTSLTFRVSLPEPSGTTKLIVEPLNLHRKYVILSKSLRISKTPKVDVLSGNTEHSSTAYKCLHSRGI